MVWGWIIGGIVVVVLLYWLFRKPKNEIGNLGGSGMSKFDSIKFSCCGHKS